MKKYIPLLAVFLFVNDAQADQTGDCTAGSQYCEQNSMTTTSATTTTNTNTNTNTNTKAATNSPFDTSNPQISVFVVRK